MAAQPVTGGGDWGGSHLAKRLLHAEVNHPPNSTDCIPSEPNGNFGTSFIYSQHSYGHTWWDSDGGVTGDALWHLVWLPPHFGAGFTTSGVC